MICVATISIVCHSNMTIPLPKGPVVQWTNRKPIKPKISGSSPARINIYVKIQVTGDIDRVKTQ